MLWLFPTGSEVHILIATTTSWVTLIITLIYLSLSRDNQELGKVWCLWVSVESPNTFGCLDAPWFVDPRRSGNFPFQFGCFFPCIHTIMHPLFSLRTSPKSSPLHSWPITIVWMGHTTVGMNWRWHELELVRSEMTECFSLTFTWVN